MPGPKGNKNAVGNKGGRPTIYDPEIEANAIDEWSQMESAINLVGFCVWRDICPDYIYEWAAKSIVFSKALKRAKARLAERRERMANEGSLNYGSFARYQDCFDPFLKSHEDGKKEYEANLKNTQKKNDLDELVGALSTVVKEKK